MENEENLKKLATLLDELTGNNEPSNEELDYNDDYIKVYDDIHSLKKSLKNIGL